MRYLLAAAALLAAAPAAIAVADQFNSASGGPSQGTVIERRSGTSGTVGVPVDETNPLPTRKGTVTLVPLDVATVTTGGAAVTALAAGNRTAGGWIYNPSVATIALCINEVATASGTSSAGSLTCAQPGQTYMLAPSANAVSVVSSDSAHPFSGYGWK